MYQFLEVELEDLAEPGIDTDARKIAWEIDFTFPSVTSYSRGEEEMPLLKTTRLTMNLVSRDKEQSCAHIFMTAENLSPEGRAFLEENGISLKEDVFDYEFPAFYQKNDIASVQMALGASFVAHATGVMMRGVPIRF